MASSVTLKLACIVVICMVIGGPSVTEAMRCGQFTDIFSGCLYYGRGLGERMPCCRAIATISEKDTTTEARQNSCHCMVGLLNIAMVLPNFPLNPNFSGGIFAWCRAFLPYPISPSANCSSIGQTATI